jgi:Lrp/AsnC family transcriptional regulator
MLDDRDRKLLTLLQQDADIPLADLSGRLNLSLSACSRRISRLREEGYIARNVAVVDRKRLNLDTTVFVMVKTAHHSADWLERFRSGVIDIPEIVEVHRLAGNLDYIIKIVVTDIAHYDAIYKRLVSRIDLFDVSAYISMETLKDERTIPADHGV